VTGSDPVKPLRAGPQLPRIDILILGGEDGLLDDYLSVKGILVDDFAIRIGLARSEVIAVRTGQLRSLDILTFAKIMTEIGEPLGRHAKKMLRQVRDAEYAAD
jgi:hypothetical protein